MQSATASTNDLTYHGGKNLDAKSASVGLTCSVLKSAVHVEACLLRCWSWKQPCTKGDMYLSNPRSLELNAVLPPNAYFLRRNVLLELSDCCSNCYYSLSTVQEFTVEEFEGLSSKMGYIFSDIFSNTKHIVR